MGSVLVVVPWFSKEEWIETYEAAFSSDVNRWKDAKDTMLVWQARVEKLPAGIDVTLPLLQAKIIEMDPSVEESVKSIFLASALQRFVTAIVKLPQTKYYRAQSMHSLALEIGLPMHLVDLRNEIVHGHGGWGGGESVYKALEVSYTWIKKFYWDAEFQKMQASDSSDITPEAWQSFLALLRKFAKLTVAFAKKKIPTYNKVKESLIQNLEAFYPMEPEECVKAVVQHVLLPDTASGLTIQLEGDDVCQCGCCVDAHVLARVAPLLACFCTLENGIELLLSCLIRKGNECQKLSSEWLCIICGALLEVKCFSSDDDHCTDHSLLLEEPGEGVDWPSVLMDLLQAQSEWASHIANRIMDSPATGLSDGQKEKIMALLCLLNGGREGGGAEDTKSCNQARDLYTVDDILTAAKGLPLAHRRKLENIRISTVGPAAELVTVDSPVGVLAHQNDNSLLYKEMVLHYSDSGDGSSSSKRRRLQAEAVC